MRLLPNLFVLMLAIPVFAEDLSEAELKAKAAIALAKAKRDRDYAKADAKCYEDLRLAESAVKRTGKPLVMWVGMHCEDVPETRKQLAGAIHVHIPEYNGDKSPRVIFTTSTGNVMSFSKDTMKGCKECASQIRDLAGLKTSP